MTDRRARKREFIERMKRLAKLGYLKILRLDDPPEKIAMSVSMGVFIGIMPSLGIGIILCIAGAHVFKLNKAAAILGSFIMNPLTTPVFISLSMSVGGLIFWQDSAMLLSHGASVGIIKQLVGNISLMYLTGNTIVSLIFSGAAYLATKRFIIRYRARKAARRLKKMHAQSLRTGV
jgi:hypothetical protein